MESSDAIRELRIRLEESQQIFATNLGISIRSLVNYEKQEGARTPPLEVTLKLAASAWDSGHKDLAAVFGGSLRKRLTAAVNGQSIESCRRFLRTAL